MHKIKKNKTISFSNLLMSYIIFIFLTTISLPVTVYYLNNEVAFEGLFWLKSFLAVTTATSIVLLFFSKISPKINRTLYTLAITLSAYVIIRGYIIPIQTGSLNGIKHLHNAISFNANFHGSICILIISYFLTLFFQKQTHRLIACFAVTLLLFSLVIYGKQIYQHKENYQKLFDYNTVSTTKNIIILSFDSIQGDILNDTLEKNPELKKIFAGFTIYQNTASYSPRTSFSLESTMAGAAINGISDKQETLDKPRLHLDEILNKNGYKASTHMGAYDGKINEIKNRHILKARDFKSMNTVSAYDAALMRVLPWINSVNNFSIGSEDIILLEKLYADINFTDKPVFKFYHYLFTHGPITFDKNCAFSTKNPNTWDGASGEIICTLKHINNYIALLKKNGVYDNTMLIITSDHGSEFNIQPDTLKDKKYYGGFLNENRRWSPSRYWPILLIKNFNSKGTLKENHSPVSLLDIAPTIYDHENYEGINLLKAENINPNRTRKFIYIHLDPKDVPTTFGKAFDTSSYSQHEFKGKIYDGVYQAYKSLSLKTSLNCGSTILFNDQSNRNYFADSLMNYESWGRSIKGDTVNIFFLGDAKNCQQNNISLQFKNSFSSQNAKVFLNNQRIGDIIISPSNDTQNIITLHYPENLYKHNTENKLTIELASLEKNTTGLISLKIN